MCVRLTALCHPHPHQKWTEDKDLEWNCMGLRVDTWKESARGTNGRIWGRVVSLCVPHTPSAWSESFFWNLEVQMEYKPQITGTFKDQVNKFLAISVPGSVKGNAAIVYQTRLRKHLVTKHWWMSVENLQDLALPNRDKLKTGGLKWKHGF